MAFPRLHTALTARSNQGTATQVRSLGIQLEASLLTAGITGLLKAAVSRPRPYTYLHTYERDDSGPNFATSDQTFESFPSGQPSLAWVSAVSTVTFAAVERPDLAGSVHALVEPPPAPWPPVPAASRQRGCPLPYRCGCRVSYRRRNWGCGSLAPPVRGSGGTSRRS